MKSSLTVMLAAGVGMVLGFALTTALGVRDSICAKLLYRDPVYVGIQRNISTSYKRLGNACMALDVKAAEAAYRQSLPIDLGMTAAFPDDLDARAAAAYCDERLGLLAMSQSRYTEAAHFLWTAIQILEPLDRGLKPSDPLPAWILADDAPLNREEKAAGRAIYRYWIDLATKNYRALPQRGEASP